MQGFQTIDVCPAPALHSPTRLARAHGELYLGAAKRALSAGAFHTAMALVEEGLRLVPASFNLSVGDQLVELQSSIRQRTPVPCLIRGEVIVMSPGAVMGPEVGLL